MEVVPVFMFLLLPTALVVGWGPIPGRCKAEYRNVAEADGKCLRLVTPGVRVDGDTVRFFSND